MFKTLLVTLTLLSINNSVLAQKIIYSMEDLRVLRGQESYEEFFEHAHDIKPSLRNDEWQKMTEQMGLNWLENLLKKPKLTQEDYTLVKKISSWPIFKNDEFFREKRDAYFIRQLSQCETSKTQDCLEKAKRLYLDYEHAIKFKADFVKTLYPKIINLKLAWEFTKPVAESKYGEFYCHHSPLDDIIISRLLTAQDTEIHPDCLKSLKPAIIEGYLTTDPSHSEGLYKLIVKYGFQEKELDHYQKTVQFLQGHLKDLNHLKDLSLKIEQRNRLVSQLKKSPYLPDNIFKITGDSKAQSYIRIVERYFPEYLKLYSETCLDYLSGSKVFPRGNPTPHCHDLFSLNEKLNLLPHKSRQRYKEYTKFMR